MTDSIQYPVLHRYGDPSLMLNLRHIIDRLELDRMNFPRDCPAAVEISIGHVTIAMPTSAFLGLLKRVDII